MTRRTNSRVAGFTFLIYIAVALSAMMLLSRADVGEGTAEKLAGIARHASSVRLGIVMELAGCFCAMVLAVTLYAITRDQDPDLARLAMNCCAAEGVIGALSLPRGLGRLWLATAAGTGAPDPAAAATIGTLLMKLPDWSPTLGVTFFAVGTTIFAWLFLRGRMVPTGLSRLGVFASIVPVILLPMRLVGIPLGPAHELMWLPMLVFQVSIALWLIVKGAAMPALRTTAGEA